MTRSMSRCLIINCCSYNNCVRFDGMAGFLANLCVLLSSCSERDSSCSSCHSAPVPCSQQIGSTSTTSTSTTSSPTPTTTKGRSVSSCLASCSSVIARSSVSRVEVIVWVSVSFVLRGLWMSVMACLSSVDIIN